MKMRAATERQHHGRVKNSVRMKPLGNLERNIGSLSAKHRSCLEFYAVRGRD
jgi:hypothetical protein